MKLKYIPHIDALRGIAVLLVLLYHFDVRLFSGGFIGVDIFFVISGYLISNIIHDKLNNNTFSFKDFYLRRIKRLLPAALVTVILTLIAALFIFPINLFEKVVKSCLPSILSFSNIYFFQKTGYFDSSSTLKPLLHTWSLSVEEQFYLIWPLLIYLYFKLKKRTHKTLLFSVIGIISLLFSEYYLSIDESASFYLTPFRVFEFLIGAITLNFNPTIENKKFKDFITFTSLVGLIVISIIYNNNIKFPGINALIPCILSILLILYTNEKSIIGKIYNNQIFRFIGKISYSLYLVHWPILVFYKYKIHQDLNTIDVILLLFISLIFALGLFYFIENKIRYSLFKSKKTLPIAMITSILLLALINILVNNIDISFLKNKEFQEYTSKEIKYEINHRYINVNNSDTIKNTTDFKDSSLDKRVLIIGDSHAPDALNFLKIAYPDYEYRIITNGGCAPMAIKDLDLIKNHPAKLKSACESCMNSLFSENTFNNFDYIVISVYFGKYTPKHLINFIKKTKETSNPKIIVFGNFITLKKDLPDLIANGGIDYNKDVLNYDLYNNELSINAKGYYDFYSKTDLLCSSKDVKDCEFILDNDKLLTYDTNHLSYYACEIIAKNIIDKKLQIFK